MEINVKVKNEELETRINYYKKIAVEQIQSDFDQYGEDFRALIKENLPPLRIGSYKYSDEEKQDALKKILGNYPESYAAIRAVCLKIVESSRRSDIEEAEQYYDTLLKMQRKKPDRAILKNGLEAVSHSGLALAWAYLMADRIEDSEKMIRFLEENNSDCVYRILTSDEIEPMIVTSEEAFAQIRDFGTKSNEYII